MFETAALVAALHHVGPAAALIGHKVAAACAVMMHKVTVTCVTACTGGCSACASVCEGCACEAPLPDCGGCTSFDCFCPSCGNSRDDVRVEEEN